MTIFNPFKQSKKINLFIYATLFIIYVFINFNYIINAPIWNPFNDELAHIDYIDRIVNENRFPIDGELISDRSFKFHNDLHIKHYPGFDGKKENLFVIGNSYEAHQPPMYYLTMAAPYYFIMSADISPYSKLTLLRIISYLFQLAGILLIFFIFKEINANFTTSKITMDFQWIIVLFILITTIQFRAGINNDQLSLLGVNFTIFFSIRFFKTKHLKHALSLSIFAVFSFFIKYTNGIITLLAAIFLLYQTRYYLKNNLTFLFTLIPFITIPLFFIHHGINNGWDNVLNNKINNQLFVFFRPGMLSVNEFFKLHWAEFFNFDFLELHLNPLLQYYTGLILYLVGFALWIYFLIRKKTHFIWSASMFITLILYIAIIYLNKSVCCVAWYSFRLYSGYMFFISLFILGWLSSENKLILLIRKIILFLLILPPLHYWLNE